MITIDFQLQHAVLLTILFVCPIISLAIFELVVLPTLAKDKKVKGVRNGKY